MKKLLFFLIIILVLPGNSVKADEGMWIPLLLNKNIADMQAKGLKLSAEDIFSMNHSSLKDAIVIFGGGCTGELISDEGLLITNHHCGYSSIQRHSSIEHDYLTDGFWAMNRNEELVNKGLTVTFLVRMADVTSEVLKDVNEQMSETERSKIIGEAIKKIVERETKGTHYEAVVKPFYYGNEYYLFVNEVFKDVRLVGAPPSAIGKFGGDTDNWMWPRHTGDFSLFRIYADQNNKPAEYSPDNKPYKPKKSFAISVKGVKDGDFTMVYGYPGTTMEYLPSFAVENTLNISNPNKIKVRQEILDIMKADMNADPKVRIQYASKNARVANAWKKWIGESRGLVRLHAIEKKKELEKQYNNWVGQDPERRKKYSMVLPELKKVYTDIKPYQLAQDYFWEAGYSMELVRFARSFVSLSKLDKNASEEEIQKTIKRVKGAAKSFFKDYNQPTDMKIFRKVFLEMYPENVPEEFQPDIFKQIDKKFKGDKDKYLHYLYSKSMLVHEEKLMKFLDTYSPSKASKLHKDPAIQLYNSLIDLYKEKLSTPMAALNHQSDSLMRLWMNILREMQSNKHFYPDANFTLRIAYGQVKDYYPRDGVYYGIQTTLEGIMEKDNPEIYDYKVPEKLKELYRTKDYGMYGMNESMPVCFIATNHTTGGNSGSPVINGNGELIGVNFDRDWEGTMSDIMYDPDMCRNITLDIRYALFLIDKFAGAQHLIAEMNIVR